MTKKHVILIVLLGFVLACKKDMEFDILPEGSTICSQDSSDCPPLVLVNDSLQTLLGWVDYNVGMPHFNPNNDDEFLFVEEGSDGSADKIWIFNMLSGDAELLAEMNGIFHQPQWHSNDWIIFSSYNNVHRIKSDGDSLIQMTVNNVFQTPEWRPDGNAWTSNNVAFFAGNVEVFDLEGNVIDEIEGEDYDFGDWNEQGRLAINKPGAYGFDQIAWVESEEGNWNYLDFDTISPQMEIQDMHWVPMTDLLMYSQFSSGISIIDVETAEILEVREGCRGRYYTYFSINSDCTKILAQRITIEEVFADGWFNYLVQRSDVVLMDFNGSCEEVVEL